MGVCRSLACVLLGWWVSGGLAPTLKNWRVLAVFGVVSALSFAPYLVAFLVGFGALVVV